MQGLKGTAAQPQNLTGSDLFVQGMGWEGQCGEDLRHLLHTLQHLPMDPSQAASNVAPLVNLCKTRFAALPSQPSSSTASNTGGERHLHRSLTENDAQAQKRRDGVQPLSFSSQQHQKPEPDREAAGSSHQGAVLAERAGCDLEADHMMHHGLHTAAGSIHGASQQSDAVDASSAFSIPQGAPQSSSLQSATRSSANGTGSPEGQSSMWNETPPPDSHSGQAGQEAQSAAVVLEAAADQDVGMADDGEVDMVATSSAMLADPAPSVKLLSHLSTSITGPTLDSGGVAVSLPDDSR